MSMILDPDVLPDFLAFNVAMLLVFLLRKRLAALFFWTRRSVEMLIWSIVLAARVSAKRLYVFRDVPDFVVEEFAAEHEGDDELEEVMQRLVSDARKELALRERQRKLRE